MDFVSQIQSQIAAGGATSVGTPTWWKTASLSADSRTVSFDNGGSIDTPAPGGSAGIGDQTGGATIKNVDSTIYVDGRRITPGQTIQGSTAGYVAEQGGAVNKGHQATQAELDALAASHESPDTQQDITAAGRPTGMSTGAKVAIGAGALGIAALAFKKMKKRKT